MAGEELTAARVAFTGLTGDRIYAFVDPQGKESFPWHSARQQHDLLLYQPRLLNPPSTSTPYPGVEAFRVEVTTPLNLTLPIDSAELLAEIRAKAGKNVQLRFSEKGMQDSRPISIFGFATLAALGSELEQTLDARRFRANFYVRLDDPTPFAEDQLVGRRLKVGETLEVEVVKKDSRCIMINVDPDTGVADLPLLKTVARVNRGSAGVYAAVLRDGVVRCGDSVALLDD